MDKPSKGFTRLKGQLGTKASLIEAAAALAGDATLAAFVPQLYAHVSGRDLEGRSAEGLHAAAAVLWAEGAARTPGAPKIAVANPAGTRRTVVSIVNDDMPFLVDSVSAEIARQGFAAHLIIHPILRVRRDSAGRLIELAKKAAKDAAAESWMRIEIDQCLDEGRLAQLRAGLERVLGDVRAAIEDWQPMLARAKAILRELSDEPPGLAAYEIDEAKDFLKWLVDNNFTFLGYREYALEGAGDAARFKVVPKSGLGILRCAEATAFEALGENIALPPDVRAFLVAPLLLQVHKADRRSTVHRPVHLDAISIKTFDAAGEVSGERLFVGLFTSMVYVRSPRNIPLLKSKIERVLARSDLTPGSHDAKALEHVLLTYPRDELFQIGDDDLLRIATGVLELQDRQRVALFLRFDPFQRFVSALVYVPRDRHSTELRQKVQAILERELKGQVVAYYTTMADDIPTARVHFIVKTAPAAAAEIEEAALEAKIVEAARTWDERLRDALADAHGEASALALLERYGKAFPVGYMADVAPADAVADIARIEAAQAGGRLQMHLHRRGGEAVDLRFRLYNRSHRIGLSDVLPVLEAMGLKVIEEAQYVARPQGGEAVWIHDFGLVPVGALAGDVAALAPRFHEAFQQVWSGAAESDGFNALVLTAGLAWREISVLRAYAKYLRQAGAPFGQKLIEEALAKHGGIAKLLAELFLVRAGAAKGNETALAAEIATALEQVSALDEDRIIRRYVNLIRSTLRTNYRQRGADGSPRPALAFKFDSRKLDDLPAPRPMFEIWVYSPRVEGIHLRFGHVARGGIRWSDRRDDFRTEILALVKAQTVKNAVIVPVGAKGGFVLKQPPAAGGREALQAEGVACYRIFIRSLLDITDNIKGGAIVPPKDVARHDGDDAYLVVAADKGTATFSDIANAISAEYGHWLGDAFASGGSAGYDHKKMGITAKGAWISVMRHFREMGIDTQSQDFAVIGVGDMSGDVFGNGMLLSPHIRLVAAFDHRHIFVDPEPDAARSIAERRRLFDLPRSSWADYDRSLISKGGGVFERGAKAIPISPEMRARFGIDKDSLSPVNLMRALLAAPCDLLYFGGIGTYVKASDERHADAGDRANDALRVDGREIRAKVIAEGANLGMTQRGRVEYARLGAGGKGGRLNTDAIDNSAGVDCSDHEVNIKILFSQPVGEGKLTLAERDALLAGMTDEVAELVLRDNYLQTACLSVSSRIAAGALDRQWRFMKSLEKAGRLDRAVEFLPDDETLAERQGAGEGLTRPEMAVLLAYAKIALYEALLGSDLPDDPYLAGDLLRYFPQVLQQRYRDAALAHRLRREIVATHTTNSIINRAGITFIHEVEGETGASPSDVARGYILGRDAFDLRSIWSAIEAHDGKVPAEAQLAALLETGRFAKRAAKWFLQHAVRPVAMAAEIERYRAPLAALAGALPALLAPDAAAALEKEAAGRAAAGFAPDLARRLALLPRLIGLAEIVRLAGAARRDPAAVARVYFAAGARFGLDWLREAASNLRGATSQHWDKMALAAIVDDLYGHQFALARAVIEGGDASDTIEAWARQRGSAVAQTAKLIDDLRMAGTTDLAMLAVANRQLRALVGG
ncbi:MAG: NAD-glutamate dehydrogenase [Candidatus Odyssella sp.]|nr:NAD-glutamate dehydrogenase [Candidatus Odyssella sp.]